jgi:hypothetical protein
VFYADEPGRYLKLLTSVTDFKVRIVPTNSDRIGCPVGVEYNHAKWRCTREGLDGDDDGGVPPDNDSEDSEEGEGPDVISEDGGLVPDTKEDTDNANAEMKYNIIMLLLVLILIGGAAYAVYSYTHWAVGDGAGRAVVV